MKNITCAEAREIDLVEYLYALGYNPEKVRNMEYWYRSPLRNERTASFKVNRMKGLWYDFGTGQGGNIIDFGVLYHKSIVREVLTGLKDYKQNRSLFFHQQNQSQATTLFAAGEEKNSGNKIVITDTGQISSISLIDYVETRGIPIEIAHQYCTEVEFELYGKKQTVIGFENDFGGFELRSPDFKGSSSPKTSRFIDRGLDVIYVFEGFFDFLSFQTLKRESDTPVANYLILNSLAFLERNRKLMEKHQAVHLFLDRGQAGISQTRRALEWNNAIYIDNSLLYKEYPDLNVWLIRNQNGIKPILENKQKPILKQLKLKRHGRI
jgi:Toprim-like/CHC2 zinc finger